MAKRREPEPIGTDDDYEIDLRDDIDDESETEGSGSLKFTITSYGPTIPSKPLLVG
jgi:hypothetical protein